MLNAPEPVVAPAVSKLERRLEREHGRPVAVRRAAHLIAALVRTLGTDGEGAAPPLLLAKLVAAFLGSMNTSVVCAVVRARGAVPRVGR